MKNAGTRIAIAIGSVALVYYLTERAASLEGAAAFLDKGRTIPRVTLWIALVVALGFSLKDSELKEVLVTGGIVGGVAGILIQIIRRHQERMTEDQARAVANKGLGALGLQPISDQEGAEAELANVLDLEAILKQLEEKAA